MSVISSVFLIGTNIHVLGPHLSHPRWVLAFRRRLCLEDVVERNAPFALPLRLHANQCLD
jgi:hypothetical protein